MHRAPFELCILCWSTGSTLQGAPSFIRLEGITQSSYHIDLFRFVTGFRSSTPTYRVRSANMSASVTFEGALLGRLPLRMVGIAESARRAGGRGVIKECLREYIS